MLRHFSPATHEKNKKKRFFVMKYLNLLLLLPFVGLLWVPLYDKADPALLGFPFFYWYQFAWVPVTSVIIWIVWKKGNDA